MSIEIEGILISDIQKDQIIKEIMKLFGNKKIPDIIEKNTLINLNSGVWLVSNEIFNFIKNIEWTKNIKRDIKYCGVYLGAFRKEFGLSLESLYFLKDEIKRFIILKGKTLQKFLYGKNIQIKLSSNLITDQNYDKAIIMTPEKEPVGIGRFKVVESIDNNIDVLEIESIIDLGFYLRKEARMFQ